MRIKKITLSQILDLLGSEVIEIIGNASSDLYIDNLADFQHINATSLDWINSAKADKQEIAKNSMATILLVGEDINPIDGKTLIICHHPKVALGQVGNHFFADHYEPFIHPTAVIDPEAKIGARVYIGPYAVVGKATIGDDCVIESNVRIYDDVAMGKRCKIKPGAVLGGEGFGFEKDDQGNRFRFPQIGGLIMGDDVEVGANTCIDRGALSDTIIGTNTKINNLCHIAHNNIIGRNVEITGCVNVSGSSIIDDNVWLAPNSSLRGFIHIGEGAVLGMGAVAVKDIPAHETWVGNPAHKLEKKH